MELVRDGVRAPELVSIEAYLRRHRDELSDALRTTLGPTYDPENHPATHWLAVPLHVPGLMRRLAAGDSLSALE